MTDYFSSDGGYSDKETPTKDCDTCRGKGWKKSEQYITVTWGTHNFVRIPSYRKCLICDGSGVIDLDETEIWINEQSRLQDEADLKDDK